MSPKRIFSSIFQLSTFFSTHLTLKAFLITWGRLHEWMVEWLRIHPSFRSSVVRSSKVVTVLIHSVQHLSSAVEELSPILMMAAIKSCWSCSSRGLPVLPLVNDLKLSAMFGFFLHTFESVSRKFWCFFCLRWAFLFNLCKRLLKQ